MNLLITNTYQLWKVYSLYGSKDQLETFYYQFAHVERIDMVLKQFYKFKAKLFKMIMINLFALGRAPKCL